MGFKQLTFYIILFTFLVTTLYVTVDPNIRLINKISGVGFFFHWLVYTRSFNLHKGIKRYYQFIIFCIVSFPFTGGVWIGVLNEVQTMVQLSAILFFVYNSNQDVRTLKAIAILFLAYFIFAYFGDSIGITPNLELDDDGLKSGRLVGATQNANTLGFLSLLGLISSIYLIGIYDNYITKFLNKYWPLLFIIFGLLLLPTGSRKSFITLVFIFIGYNYLRNKNIIITSVSILTLTAIIYVISFDWIMNIFQDSVMGQRFLDESNLERGRDIRLSLYTQGLQMFLSNPVVGVGLNNFRFNSLTGHVAHSYYIEILAGTGIIGFMILLSVYRLVFVRGLRLFRSSTYYHEGVFILNYLLVYFIMSFGFSHHKGFEHWITLSIFFAFFKSISKKYESIHSR